MIEILKINLQTSTLLVIEVADFQLIGTRLAEVWQLNITKSSFFLYLTKQGMLYLLGPCHSCTPIFLSNQQLSHYEPQIWGMPHTEDICLLYLTYPLHKSNDIK